MKQLFTADEVVRVTGGRLIAGREDQPVFGVATDSRVTREGDLFFALPGERVDGHGFVEEVLNRGASGSVVSREGLTFPPGTAGILVKDTTLALGDLASHHRAKFDPAVIGITGSVGKTTTKEMVAAVLSRRFETLKNRGNLNTEVGLPLTVFELTSAHEVAVLEMAMRGLGQITYLARIARPKIGIVTNVGQAHIEILGSVENIARAKGELIWALPADGTAILNHDDPLVRQMAEDTSLRTVFYGVKERPPRGADWVTALDARTVGPEGQQFVLEAAGFGVSGEVYLPLPGKHNLLNALAAAAAGLVLGMTLEEIRDGLAAYSGAGNRLQINLWGDIRVINDTYNANPVSTLASLEVLREVAGGARSVAVLGSMFELGEVSEIGHRQVGREAAKKADLLVAVGDLARWIAAGAASGGMPEDRISWYGSNAEAAETLQRTIKPGDTVLVKGSRGMRMEEIVAALEKWLR